MKPLLSALFLFAAGSFLFGCSKGPGADANANANANADGKGCLTSNAPAKKGGAVIASYGDQTLTADELQAKFNEKNPIERGRYNTLEIKKEAVENIVRFELLAQEAQRRGLDHDPEVMAAAQAIMVRKLVHAEIDDNPEKNKISDDDVKAFYQAHLSDYVRPEMVRVSAIVLPIDAQHPLAQRKAEAEKAHEELQKRASDYSAFPQMARAMSNDPSQSADGDIQLQSKDQLTTRFGPEVAEAAFALRAKDELSPPVVTSKAVVLLKLTSRTPPLNDTLDDEKVRTHVRTRMWLDRRNKLYEEFAQELEKKANYTVNEKALDEFKVSTTAPTNFGSLPPPGNHIPPPGLGAPPNRSPGTPGANTSAVVPSVPSRIIEPTSTPSAPNK